MVGRFTNNNVVVVRDPLHPELGIFRLTPRDPGNSKFRLTPTLQSIQLWTEEAATAYQDIIVYHADEKEAAEEAKPSAAPRRGRSGACGGRGRGRAAATSARGTRKEVVVSDSEFEDISISDIDAGPAVKGKTKKETTPEEVSYVICYWYITIDEERRNRFLWDDLCTSSRYAN
ncbi:hypothetical protein C8Q79DRAFT_1014233 [Trametes meyenii]|nr:hypothetical protein C8Q79DRAFT_1014233 [Trametes meyenii]